MPQLPLPRLLITHMATGWNCNGESGTSHLKQIIASDLKNPEFRLHSIYEMEQSQNNYLLAAWKRSFLDSTSRPQSIVFTAVRQQIFYDVLCFRQSRVIKTTPKFLSTNIMFGTSEKRMPFDRVKRSSSSGTPEALIRQLRMKRAPGLGMAALLWQNSIS